MRREQKWWRSFRTLEDVDVFVVDLSADREREAIAFRLLDQDEASRCERYLVDGARRQFLLSRGAVRLLLADRLGCSPGKVTFRTGRNGKPDVVLDGVRTPIYFNLSHSGTSGLIAVSPSRSVGVDVEERRDRIDLDGVAKRVFSESERAALLRLMQPEKTQLFFRLWTLKEALIKAKGTGFSYNPAGFAVPQAVLGGADQGLFGFPEEGEPKWVLFDLGCEAFAAALAVSRSPPEKF